MQFVLSSVIICWISIVFISLEKTWRPFFQFPILQFGSVTIASSYTIYIHLQTCLTYHPCRLHNLSLLHGRENDLLWRIWLDSTILRTGKTSKARLTEIILYNS